MSVEIKELAEHAPELARRIALREELRELDHKLTRVTRRGIWITSLIALYCVPIGIYSIFAEVNDILRTISFWLACFSGIFAFFHVRRIKKLQKRCLDIRLEILASLSCEHR